MRLKIYMGDKTHRYYKHTKFRQNPRGDPNSWLIWHGMTHMHTNFNNFDYTALKLSDEGCSKHVVLLNNSPWKLIMVNSLLQVIIRHVQLNKAQRADNTNSIVYLWYKECLGSPLLLWLLWLITLPQLWILKHCLSAPVWANKTSNKTTPADDVSRLVQPWLPPASKHFTTLKDFHSKFSIIPPSSNFIHHWISMQHNRNYWYWPHSKWRKAVAMTNT